MITHTQQIEITEVAGDYRLIIDARDFFGGDDPEVRLVGAEISPMYFSVTHAEELGTALLEAAKIARSLNGEVPR